MTWIIAILLFWILSLLVLLGCLGFRALRSPDMAEQFEQWAADQGWDITRFDEFNKARVAYCQQCFFSMKGGRG